MIRATGYKDVFTEREPSVPNYGYGVLDTYNVYVGATYVGQIVSYRRKLAKGSEYGCMPAKAHRRSRLTGKREAIAALLADGASSRNAIAAPDA